MPLNISLKFVLFLLLSLCPLVAGTQDLPADLNQDQIVDSKDLLLFRYYMHENHLSSDLNQDGIVNEHDLYLFATSWHDQSEINGSIIPPNPVNISTQVMQSGMDTFLDRNRFLYEAEPPIITNIEPSILKADKAAVIRGQLFNRNAQPLSGIRVSILNNPEYGQTLTRSDGRFDLLVNGGNTLVVQFNHDQYLPVQRKAKPPLNDYFVIEEVCLTPLDPKVSQIAAGSEQLQLAEGSVMTDADGTRQACIMFKPGTQAQIELPDGSSMPLESMDVRATEFTVGEDGPQAMPGILPADVGYTYCVEFTVDEAINAGATNVQFDRTLAFYLENFLEFPAGGIVPMGYFDRERSEWIASRNGRVIDYLGDNGSGLANLDITGDGNANSLDELSTIGINEDERRQLVAMYEPGQSLWRVEIDHFTPWDCNWPYGPPEDAIPPDWIPDFEEPEPEDCPSSGSIINPLNQTLDERVQLAGTGMDLYYTSAQTPGRKTSNTINLNLSSETVPESLLGIKLEIQIAGNKIVEYLSPDPNQNYEFVWEGVDAYGRKLQGTQPVNIRVGYDYQAVYMEPDEFENSFGRLSGQPLENNRARQSFTVWDESALTVGTVDSRGLGFGGWRLSEHHFYDPNNRTILFGDGSRSNAQSVNNIITTIAGRGPWFDEEFDFEELPFDPSNFAGIGEPANGAYLFPPINDIEISPDGLLHFFSMNEFVRINEAGIIEEVSIETDEEVTTFVYFNELEFGTDGSIYMLRYYNNFSGVVFRYSPDGTVTKVAGKNFVFDFTTPEIDIGDGGPATEAPLLIPQGIAVNDSGELYISDTFNNLVRKVGTDGIITTIAGTGESGFSGDGGPARQAQLASPKDIVLDDFGNIYINDEGNDRIRKITPDGIIQTIAGNGEFNSTPFSAEGRPATEATLGNIDGMEIGPDNSLYISIGFHNVIRRITPDGIIRTIVGNGTEGFSGDGGDARDAQLGSPHSIAFDAEGNLYFSDSQNATIRKVGSSIPSTGFGTFAIPSSDRELIYIFDSSGRHQETRYLLSGATKYQFNYDEDGTLAEIIDQEGKIIQLERDNLGQLIAIHSPYGQVTGLDFDNNGYISQITDPEGNQIVAQYTDTGLLTQFTNARGITNQYEYDNVGRLTSKTDSLGRQTTLTRELIENGYQVVYTEPLGNQTFYQSITTDEGGSQLRILDTNNRLMEKTTMPNGTTISQTEENMLISQSFKSDPQYGIMAPVLDLMEITTPNGLSAIMKQNRIIETDDDGNLTHFLESLMVNDATYTAAYQAADQTLEVTSPTGVKSRFTIDSFEQPLTIQPDDRYGQMTLTYAGFDNLATINYGGGTWTFNYNELGAVESMQDPSGNQTMFETNALGQDTRFTLPSGRAYQFEYDATGNLSAFTMPNGEQYNYGYNDSGKESAFTTPDGATFNQSYNSNGRITQYELPSTRSINYDYDMGNRPISESYPEASITYNYADGTDRPSQIIRNDEQGNEILNETYQYDGSLITQIAWTGDIQGSIDYTYNNQFQPTEISINGSISIPIERNLVADIVQKGPFTYQREGFNNAPSSITDGNMTVDYTYDDYGRLQSRNHKIGETTFYSIQLNYDINGKIVEQHETFTNGEIISTYQYDVDGQLIEVSRDNQTEENYSYDPNGNRSDGTYNQRGQLETWNSISYSYDVDGFLQSRGNDSFTYSTQGELLRANLQNSSQVNYLYDHSGRLRARTQGDNTTQFIYTETDLPYILHAAVSNQGDQSIYYHDDGGIPYAMQRNGEWYAIACDMLGTPKVVVDSSGTVIKRIDYSGYGEVISDSNPPFVLWVGFAGGLYDPATEMVRFGQRDYEPKTGRWTAEDPLRFQGGELNLYAYVGNDPVNYRDEKGTQRSLVSRGWDWVKSFWETKEKAEKAKKAYDTAERVQETLESDQSDPEQARDLMECILDWVPWWGADAGKEMLDFKGFNPTSERRDIGRAKERLENDACPECEGLFD